MKYIGIGLLIILLPFFSSCSDQDEGIHGVCDSSVHFVSEDFGTFGTEIIANYNNNLLVECHVLIKDIYNEKLLRFYFSKDTIMVYETVVFYQYPVIKKQEYYIDTIWDELTDSVSFSRYIINYDDDILWKSDSSNSMNDISIIFHKLKSLLSIDATQTDI